MMTLLSYAYFMGAVLFLVLAVAMKPQSPANKSDKPVSED